jgi:hypothetical protein
MTTTPRTSAAGHTLPGSELRRVAEHIQARLDQELRLARLGAVDIKPGAYGTATLQEDQPGRGGG